MKVTLKVWRQNAQSQPGGFKDYPVEVTPDASFLEAIDIVNDQLIREGDEPIAFEHDCREGICGSCGAMVNGRAHGPGDRATLCQLHMRSFKSGDVITVEPWRAEAFPVVKDLIVDRSAFDEIIRVGGFISARTGSAPDANATPISKPIADDAFDAAACIGCGACAAACPNASASLFAAAKLSHLNSLPQGQAEKAKRTHAIVNKMDELGFGNCTNHGECEAVCPKGISIKYIAQMNRDLLLTSFFQRN